MTDISIRPATPDDVATILRFVQDLAAFEREPDAVEATEAMLGEALFGPQPAAEAVIAEEAGAPVGFALFFHNFSTWKGRRGLYLEDLYVTPVARGRGVGGALLRYLAGIAVERNCARFEWAVLDWNADAIAVYRRMGAVGLEDWTVQRVEGEALRRMAGA
ncbi:GNAT family acetyltransferase [Sphingomonas melonis TY]|jgi:GNAT superfamily N-acetyltransferase|nr:MULTISPECIES: GNAT family N-acetyltransferase [Sphingomonas]AOW22818.1 GNAT family N-acetyltransferase [Sphingomonas melonis TY]ATI56225.1 GNAT family N-acetyltransferase [Sphingomonas melonis]KZB95133.1 GNAT family acetyltransferase [Sphingomonas melonis TY]MBI0530865.1 GNAT family N-acetyltransferase [Sphingomonas sp. TX0522]MBX8845051.1 GNAT family N-acetyltransferase [Sphingomonas melonis]